MSLSDLRGLLLAPVIVRPRLKALALEAAVAGIGLTVDAEEADRLDLSLDVIEAVSGASDLAGWNGFGIAVQAYQKRALQVLGCLTARAARNRRRPLERSGKGAYRAQEGKLSPEIGQEGS